MKNAIPCHQQGKQGGSEELVGGNVAVVTVSLLEGGGLVGISVVTARNKGMTYTIVHEP